VRTVTADIGWYVVSEKWHNFWELPETKLLGLFEVAGKSTIFPKLHTNRYSCNILRLLFVLFRTFERERQIPLGSRSHSLMKQGTTEMQPA